MEFGIYFLFCLMHIKIMCNLFFGSYIVYAYIKPNKESIFLEGIEDVKFFAISDLNVFFFDTE